MNTVVLPGTAHELAVHPTEPVPLHHMRPVFLFDAENGFTARVFIYYDTTRAVMVNTLRSTRGSHPVFARRSSKDSASRSRRRARGRLAPGAEGDFARFESREDGCSEVLWLLDWEENMVISWELNTVDNPLSDTV